MTARRRTLDKRGGGVDPEIRYLTAELQPGQDIARPWHFDDEPLLMLFDKATEYEALAGDAETEPVQGRNAVIDDSGLDATDERPNFPEDRHFNAVCLTLGQATQSLDAPPRPFHEPDTGIIRDFPPEGNAATLVTDYAEDRMAGEAMLFVHLPERDLLRAYVMGKRRTGDFDWAAGPKSVWLPFEADIFGPLDTFVNNLMANAAVRERLAGIKLSDEPDLMRRLPEGNPEIVGLMAGRVEALQPVAFRVVATERPFAWVWRFEQEGSAPLVSGADTYQPVVTFLTPGPATVTVSVGNWHGVSAEMTFSITVVAAAATATPQITGLYTKTTDGILRGCAIPDPAKATDINWSPGGGQFRPDPAKPVIGQDGRFGVCTVNATVDVMDDLTDLDLTPFPRVKWRFGPKALGMAPLEDVPSESGATLFPAYEPALGDPLLISKCNVALIPRSGFGEAREVEFALLIQPTRLDAPRGWIRPELLQVVAERVHERLVAASPPRHVRIFVNFNGAVVEERFSPAIDRPGAPANSDADPPTPARPLNHLKLRSITDVDQLEKRANRGSRNSNDFDDPAFAPDLDGTLPPPPAAIFRLHRDFNRLRSQLYSIDQYPIIGNDAQLRANVAAAFPDVAGGTTAEKINRIRQEVDTRDPVRAIHAYARFLSDLASPKRRSSNEEQTAILRRNLFTVFWCQMWGFPVRRDGDNTFNIGGVPTTLLRDPESPAPNDGWDLVKPNLLEARFQAWMSILLGAEGVAWFSQHFIADALIFLVFNPIAGEIKRYADLRGHGRLMSKRGDAGFINQGPMLDRAFMGWKNLSSPQTEPELREAGLGVDKEGNLRELLPVLNEFGLPSNPPLPVGRLEMGLACGLLQRIHEDDPTPATVEQYLFLANPSWRSRTVQLDLTQLATQAAPLEGFQEYRLGEAVTDSNFPIAGFKEITLAPREIRIYEREPIA